MRQNIVWINRDHTNKQESLLSIDKAKICLNHTTPWRHLLSLIKTISHGIEQEINKLIEEDANHKQMNRTSKNK